MTSIRLIALDIDGTLLDAQFQITQRNRSALQAAHQAGLHIMLATGRRYEYALPIARELGIPVSIISSNGAVIRSSDGKTLFTDRLPARTAHKLVLHMDSFRGQAVLTFDRGGKNSMVIEDTRKMSKSISRWIESNMDSITCVVPLEASLTEDPIQAMYCGSLALMEEAQQRLNEAAFRDEIAVLKTQYDHRDLCIVDILKRGCSKGHALRWWAGQYGLDREEIMAIGDNYNDLEMLEFAGLPVVMGNAAEELKKYGWQETASNTESGVAQAVERFLGGEVDEIDRKP